MLQWPALPTDTDEKCRRVLRLAAVSPCIVDGPLFAASRRTVAAVLGACHACASCILMFQKTAVSGLGSLNYAVLGL